jgi:hypothetical protein
MDPKFAQKVALFRATATDAKVRAEYAASRANVIQPELEVQSTVRFIFQQETLAGDATPVYDIPFEDVECTYVMPNIGGIPMVQVEGDQISVGTFGLDGGVEYQMDMARDGRFQVGTLATQMLRNKFIAQEELAGWNLIKLHAAALASNQKLQAYEDDGSVGSPNGDPTLAGTGRMNIHTINELLTVADGIGIGGRRVTDIYVSPRRFGDIRSALTMQALPEAMRQSLWGNGKGADSLADIRIHRVYNKALVNDAKGYAFTQKDGIKYGVMPIRETLKTYDNPIALLEWKIGIIGRERLGFGVLDDKGLIELTF